MRDALAADIIRRAQSVPRLVVAIAGPPGSGKSTLAEDLRARLIGAGLSPAVVPMDGYHLDNSDLDRLGLRQRKGAPETFDGEGFVKLVAALRLNKVPVEVPVFDRAKDKVVKGESAIMPEHRIILVEGNYLLLNETPWNQLSGLFDMTVFINPGMENLKKRLIHRWLDNGHTQEEAKQRAMSNDVPNAQRVLNNSMAADIVIGAEA